MEAFSDNSCWCALQLACAARAMLRADLDVTRMFKKLKQTFSDLAKGTPGKRFTDHHERHRQSESGKKAGWKTAAYVVVGLIMLFAGLLLSLPPGVPGFLLWIPALGLLAARFRFLAVFLDKAELFCRRIFEFLRRLFKK